MKYIELQRRLKSYRVAELVKVKLNSSQSILEAEYQRCLNLGLSQTELDRLVAINEGKDLEQITIWVKQIVFRN